MHLTGEYFESSFLRKWSPFRVVSKGEGSVFPGTKVSEVVTSFSQVARSMG